MPWYEHFACRFQPFSKEIADGELWVPPGLHKVLGTLEDAVRERKSAFIIGEPGVGKTCLLRALRARLADAAFRLTYCHNATLGRRDFYRQLCTALGLTPAATAAGVFGAINQSVEAMSRDRVHPIFLIDEAHLLHQDTLDHRHILMNYDYDSKALLSLVLIGLPELELRLGGKHNRALYTRIHTRLRLPPLSAEDTSAYLTHRLVRAGARADIFSSAAVTRLHEATGGGMRELDRLATDALRLACDRRNTAVDARCADEVVDNLDLRGRT
jgi:type II secretory pathway predicted ATPase ExeA